MAAELNIVSNSSMQAGGVELLPSLVVCCWGWVRFSKGFLKGGGSNWLFLHSHPAMGFQEILGNFCKFNAN